MFWDLRLEEQSVSWQEWNSFISGLTGASDWSSAMLGYQDGDELRSILYEGSLSEIFVAYADPSEG